MTVEKKSTTSAVLQNVRFSYLQVFEPRAVEEGQKPKYSVSIIIPKNDKKNVAKIKECIAAALEAGSSKFGGQIPKKYKNPLRDGDEERENDLTYENAYFINASSTNAPGVVDENKNEFFDKSRFYSGCYGHVDVNFYAFNTNGNKGVACGLNNIMKSRDGERLGGGRASAEQAFADIEDDDIM